MLKSGEDFALWPALKLLRARELWSELSSSMTLYRASLGNETRAEVPEDRLTVTFYAQIRNSPPAYHWSLLYGDIIHNYRSALDALAWEMVHLDGAAPADKFARRVYFPICRTEAEWKEAVRTYLASAPEFVLARMRSVQPFLFPPVDEGVGLHLHQLDIDDKHKALVHLELSARDKTSFALSFKMEEPEAAGRHPDDHYEWLGGDQPLEDGQAICRFRVPSPLVYASLESLPLVPMVSWGSLKKDAFFMLRLIDQQVALTFDTIERGMQARQAPTDSPLTD